MEKTGHHDTSPSCGSNLYWNNAITSPPCVAFDDKNKVSAFNQSGNGDDVDAFDLLEGTSKEASCFTNAGGHLLADCHRVSRRIVIN